MFESIDRNSNTCIVFTSKDKLRYNHRAPFTQHRSQSNLGGHRTLNKQFNRGAAMRKLSNNSSSSFEKLNINLSSRRFDSSSSSNSVSGVSSATFSGNKEEEFKVPAVDWHNARLNRQHSASLSSIMTFGNNESTMGMYNKRSEQ